MLYWPSFRNAPLASTVSPPTAAALGRSLIAAKTPTLCEDVWEQVACGAGSDLLWRLSHINRSLQNRLTTPSAFRRALQADGYQLGDLPNVDDPQHDAKIQELFHGERFFGASHQTHLKAPPPLNSLWDTAYFARSYTVVAVVTGQENTEGPWTLRQMHVFWAGQNRPTWKQLEIPYGSEPEPEISRDGRWMLTSLPEDGGVRVVHLFDLHAMPPATTLAAKFSDIPAFTLDAKALVGHSFTEDLLTFLRIDLSGSDLSAHTFSCRMPRPTAIFSEPDYPSPQRRWAIYSHEDESDEQFHMADTTGVCQPIPISLTFFNDIVEGDGGYTRDENQAVTFFREGEVGTFVYPLSPPAAPRRIIFPDSVFEPPLAFAGDNFLCRVSESGNEGLRLFSLDGAPSSSIVLHGFEEQEWEGCRVKMDGRGAAITYTLGDSPLGAGMTAIFNFDDSSSNKLLLPPQVIYRQPLPHCDDKYLVVNAHKLSSYYSNILAPFFGQSSYVPYIYLIARNLSDPWVPIAANGIKEIHNFGFVHGQRRLLLSDNENGVVAVTIPTHPDLRISRFLRICD